MVVYLDVLVLENFIVDFFLLYITCQTMRIRVKLSRICLGAFFGSLYVITLVYPSLKVFSMIPVKIIVPFVIILITFREKDFLFNVKAGLIYILYSMLLAGMCMYLLFNQGYSPDYSGVIYNFTYSKLLISIMVSYILIHRLVVYIKDRRITDSLIFTVDIIAKDQKKTVKAFFDTGNELREPATNLPVMIVEKNILDDLRITDKDKMYIPYKVVNGYNGKMEGFKPDYINIYSGKGIRSTEVIIAFCDEKLSAINDYNALLSRGIL